jgi:hypothetical protein
VRTGKPAGWDQYRSILALDLHAEVSRLADTGTLPADAGLSAPSPLSRPAQRSMRSHTRMISRIANFTSSWFRGGRCDARKRASISATILGILARTTALPAWFSAALPCETINISRGPSGLSDIPTMFSILRSKGGQGPGGSPRSFGRKWVVTATVKLAV